MENIVFLLSKDCMSCESLPVYGKPIKEQYLEDIMRLVVLHQCLYPQCYQDTIHMSLKAEKDM